MGPMIRSLAVNLMRGISAYGSCIAKIVDDITIKDSEYLSPAAKTTTKDGTMAHMRVTNARSTGLTRSSKNPSMTN